MRRVGLIFIGAMLALGGFAAAGVSIGGASGAAADHTEDTCWILQSLAVAPAG